MRTLRDSWQLRLRPFFPPPTQLPYFVFVPFSFFFMELKVFLIVTDFNKEKGLA